MTDTEVIERVAAETELQPEEIERILEMVGESVRENAEAHGIALYGSPGSGKSATFGLAFGLLMGEGRRDAESLAELLAATAGAWQSQGRVLGDLIDALTPVQRDLPTPAAVLQARRNAEARNALLAEFGALRSSEIAELAGSRAANRAALPGLPVHLRREAAPGGGRRARGASLEPRGERLAGRALVRRPERLARRGPAGRRARRRAGRGGGCGAPRSRRACLLALRFPTRRPRNSSTR
jgi:uncharacterized protein YdbL (DUF1318 family)